MKKLIFSLFLVLPAIVATSTQANAQRFRVNNNTAISYQVDYCSMSSGTVLASGSYAITSSCVSPLPCVVTLSFPGTACSSVNVTFPCPTWGFDYVHTVFAFSTGCPSDPTVDITLYYDGGTNDIIITLN